MRLRVTIDLEFSEEKIREHFVDSVAVEYLHILRGGDLDPFTRERHPTFTREHIIERLAWDAILGDDNHGADIASSMETRIEEMSPPVIKRGAEDEFCACRHYSEAHSEHGCQESLVIDLGMTPNFYGEFVLTTTAKRCPCKVKGSLVLRHPAWPGDPTVEPASELTRPAEGERV